MRNGPETTGRTIDDIQQNHTHNIKNWDGLTSKLNMRVYVSSLKPRAGETIEQNRAKNLESMSSKTVVQSIPNQGL